MFEIFTLLFLGAFIGYHVGSIHTVYKIREFVLNNQEIFLKQIQAQQHVTQKLIIEYNNNLLYLYDYGSNTFVCQGSSLEELAILAKQYNKINNAYVLDSKTNRIHKFVDGKVYES